MMFYDFKMKGITGEEISFSDYKEKVVLIVNTASECGFTPQFKGLEELYLKYKGQGLVILGFPCNQFGGQEPGTEVEIQQGCMLNYGVSFPMFSKIDVNGKNEDAFYTFLKSEKSNLLLKRIKWNFEKFLINKKGEVVARYASIKTPESLESIVQKLLAE
ncbi:glutathione peroxidase [Flavobacteriales bacterium]|nr:glutathione peroxidase [Flavobacteriales bacterium]